MIVGGGIIGTGCKEASLHKIQPGKDLIICQRINKKMFYPEKNYKNKKQKKQ